MGIGVFYNTYRYGFHGFLFSLKSMILVLLILFFVSLFIQGLGFGDIKLFMGIASCIGFAITLKTYIISLVLFILYEILFDRSKSFKKILNSIVYMKTLLFFGKTDNYEMIVQDTKPFSVFILVAFIVILIL